MLVRGIEADVLPTCERYGMAVIPWSPLNGSWLTGRLRKGAPPPSEGRAARLPQRFDPSLPENQRKLDLLDDLDAVGSEAGLPMTHLALGFVLAHPAVSSAIIGPRTMEQLEGDLGAEAESSGPVWVDAVEAVRSVLGATTIEAVAEQEARAAGAQMYYI